MGTPLTFGIPFSQRLSKTKGLPYRQIVLTDPHKENEPLLHFLPHPRGGRTLPFRSLFNRLADVLALFSETCMTKTVRQPDVSQIRQHTNGIELNTHLSLSNQNEIPTHLSDLRSPPPPTKPPKQQRNINVRLWLR